MRLQTRAKIAGFVAAHFASDINELEIPSR